MSRFSQKNLYIKYKDNVGMIYDIPTSTIFRTTCEIAKYLEEIQSTMEEDNEEYIKMVQFMEKKLTNKQEIHPTHLDFLKCRKLHKLTIIVANTCNLECKYCYANFGTFSGYEKKIMTSNEAKMYLKSLIENRIDEIEQIEFFGGEPLLAINTIDEICNFIKILVKTNLLTKVPKYSMITNMTIMNEKIKNVIYNNKIKLTVSIDGPKEINDLLRVYPNQKGTFDIICKNIEICYPFVKAIEATFTKIHEKENWTIESLKEYMTEKFKIPKETVMAFHAIGDNEICFENSVNRSEINDKYIDIDNLSIFRTINGNFQSDLFCNSGYTSIALMPNGDLYPCHMYAMDRKYLLGTFDNENKQYYDLEKLADLTRKAILTNNEKDRDDCKNCWVRNLCHICPAKVLIDKNFNSISKENCDIRRKNIGNLFFSKLAHQTN